MKKLATYCCYMLFVPLLLCIASLAKGTEGPRKKTTLLKSIKLSGNPRKLPLNQDYVLIDETGSGKKERIPVVLIRAGYERKFLIIRQNTFWEPGGALRCHELRSTDENCLFTWSTWSDYDRGHFRLFTDDSERNYLIWVEGLDLYFTEISEANDRVVALIDYVSSGRNPLEFVRIPVSELLGDRPFMGDMTHYAEIRTVSLDIEDSGKVTVKFTGVDEKKVYTLIREHGKWRDATDEKKQ